MEPEIILTQPNSLDERLLQINKTLVYIAFLLAFLVIGFVANSLLAGGVLLFLLLK